MLEIGQRVFTVSRIEVAYTAPYLFRTYVSEKAVNVICQEESGGIIYTAGKFQELTFRETAPGQYQTTDGVKRVFLSREDAEKERLARIQREGREAPDGGDGKSPRCAADLDSRYEEQRKWIDEIAATLGCVTVVSDASNIPGFARAVLLYLADDAKHNKAVAQLPVRYSKKEATEYEQATHKCVDPKCIYRDYIWFFQNTDVYGRCTPDFANQGRLDLRGDNWKAIVEGSLKLAYYEAVQRRYAAGSGGYDALREADDTYNDLNRRILDAFYKLHGRVFLGSINLSGETRKRVADEGASIFEEYTGQPVYNFGCDFVVPAADKELEQMILEWNRDGWPHNQTDVCKITATVMRLGGLCFLWY